MVDGQMAHRRAASSVILSAVFLEFSEKTISCQIDVDWIDCVVAMWRTEAIAGDAGRQSRRQEKSTVDVSPPIEFPLDREDFHHSFSLFLFSIYLFFISLPLPNSFLCDIFASKNCWKADLLFSLHLALLQSVDYRLFPVSVWFWRQRSSVLRITFNDLFIKGNLLSGWLGQYSLLASYWLNSAGFSFSFADWNIADQIMMMVSESCHS